VLTLWRRRVPHQPQLRGIAPHGRDHIPHVLPRLHAEILRGYLHVVMVGSRRFAEIEAPIRENHSYEVPEIVQLPVQQGLPAYLDWISENSSSSGVARG